MIKTFFRRLKLGTIPALVVSLIIALTVGIMYLMCISDIFFSFAVIVFAIMFIYQIGETLDKKDENFKN